MIEIDAKFGEGYCIALTSGLKVAGLVIPIYVHLTVTDFTGVILLSLSRKEQEKCWYSLKPGSKLDFDMKTFLGASCQFPLDVLPIINERVVKFNRAKISKYIHPSTKPIKIPFIF